MAQQMTPGGGQPYFYCPREGCLFRSRSAMELEFHRRKDHEKEDRPYPCNFCGKNYTSKDGYNQHSCPNHKSGSAPLHCEYCGKKCKSVWQLGNHKGKAHSDVATSFPCSVCERIFYTREGAAKHEKRHTEGTGYNCVVNSCNEPYFKTVEGLRAHVASSFHDVMQKTKVCEVCGYAVKGDR